MQGRLVRCKLTLAHPLPAITQQYFKSWGQEGTVDLFVEFSKLITMTAARTLLGALSARVQSAIISPQQSTL
jgi:hypothetical protein